MIERYLRGLREALAAMGVTGRPARRLLDEAHDHLLQAAPARGEREAVASFGEATTVARSVAAELATARTRTAAVAAFLALAPVGVAFAALFLTFPSRAGASASEPGSLAIMGAVFFPQLSFVCGVLAMLRVARLRREATLRGGDLAVVRTRAGVALAAGALTLASVATIGLDQRHALPGWWLAASLALAACLTPVLGVVGAVTLRSARFAVPDGEASGTAVEDVAAALAEIPGLRRVRIPSEPTRFALLVAGLVAAAVAIAGIVQDDPFDGLFRAAIEGLGVLGCFAVLGRVLGLRR